FVTSHRLDNPGLITVQSGEVHVYAGGTGSGRFNVASGTTCGFFGPYTFTGGVLFTGAGVNRLSADPITFTGSISSENLTWTDGKIAGTLVNPTNSIFYITTAADHDWPGIIATNRGTIVHTGGRVRNGSGGLIANENLW